MLDGRVISHEEWQREDRRIDLEAERKPFVERAAAAGDHGYYPPGSTVKCFGALLGLAEGALSPDTEILCHDDEFDHGVVNLAKAIRVSCNCYFRTLGEQLGTAKMLDWYRRCGFASAVPWLIDARSAEGRAGAVLRHDAVKNTAIGQGSMSTSPLEIATMMASLAREGRVLVPRIVARIGGNEQPASERPAIPATREHFAVVTAAMEGAFDGYAQKDRALDAYRPLRIAGKTGTAEGFTGRHAGENISWFAGFAPAHAPRFAIAVFCEHTNRRGRTVVPYSAEILKAALERPSP
jgi:cell division protein FtsI/penicillin-binding protein 2